MMAAETPTIVFVHGAWADATGFGPEIRALQNRGYTAMCSSRLGSSF
jgi:dipeptidyl aminopeptidase/acylaminoacyl peptidase